MEAQRERGRDQKVNICDSANRKRNVSQAGWEAALRAWLVLCDVTPFKVAMLNPELLKGTPVPAVTGRWEGSAKSQVCEGLSCSAAGHRQPFCSLETLKKEQDEGHAQLPPPYPWL